VSQYADQVVMLLGTSGNSLKFGIQDGSTWHWPTWTPSTPLWAANSWHHVAMSWGAASGMALYFDGQQVATDSYSGGIYAGNTSTALGNLYLSGSTNNANYVQNATVDQFRIYDYSRSPQDIARDYLGVLTLPAL
jgi:hypothetical protein